MSVEKENLLEPPKIDMASFDEKDLKAYFRMVSEIGGQILKIAKECGVELNPPWSNKPEPHVFRLPFDGSLGLACSMIRTKKGKAFFPQAFMTPLGSLEIVGGNSVINDYDPLVDAGKKIVEKFGLKISKDKEFDFLKRMDCYVFSVTKTADGKEIPPLNPSLIEKVRLSDRDNTHVPIPRLSESPAADNILKEAHLNASLLTEARHSSLWDKATILWRKIKPKAIRPPKALNNKKDSEQKTI